MRYRVFVFILLWSSSLLSTTALAYAEDNSVVGIATLEVNGEPVHGAVVLLLGSGQFATTDSDGKFAFENVPAGTYTLLVEREHLTADRIEVVVDGKQRLELSVTMSLSPVHEQVTVTTSARGQSTALEQFNAVTSLDSFDLAKNMAGSIGEVLQDEAGVSKRSFGPASSRPIIRGFDGDRVLIMQDGTRTGDLSSQSADHNVTLDPANLERIEIIKGPATLLYGSNAVGGVVNTISPQDTFRRSRPQGVRGQVLFDAGTANTQAGGNANFRYGNGSWMLWGSGGARRAGDYDTREGPVENSASDLKNGNIGAGYYAERAFFTLGYGLEAGRFGIPGADAFHDHDHDEESPEGDLHEEDEESFFIDNDQRRQNLRVDFGLQELRTRFLEGTRVTFQIIDWNHKEIEIDEGVEEVGTEFQNDTTLVRVEFEQAEMSNLTGRFGLWYQHRDFLAVGDEALAPPTTQNAFAAFAYEELQLGAPTTVSFGARLEVNDYEPTLIRPEENGGEEDPPRAEPRSFTGGSASVGLRYELNEITALVGTYTSSYRAPALEELYNFGPHIGNLAFEIGNPNLERERINGFDFSLKGRGDGIGADFNVFYYDIGNFVFPFFQDEIRDGLRVAEFAQEDARFVGFDSQAYARVHDYLWLKAGISFVNAKLTEIDEFVPRIPPLHGRVEFEIPYKALTVTPELVWSASQEDLFSVGESPTEAYTVVNLKAQYTLAQSHQAHIFSVNAYNLTDELYRMHTNFIKDFAPEIGRGIKFTYSLRFF